jgi:hypothetical protein
MSRLDGDLAIIIETSEIWNMFLFFCFIDCLAPRVRTDGLFGAGSAGLASQPRAAGPG